MGKLLDKRISYSLDLLVMLMNPVTAYDVMKKFHCQYHFGLETLKKYERMGIVESQTEPWRGTYKRFYKLTNRGELLLGLAKTLNDC